MSTPCPVLPSVWLLVLARSSLGPRSRIQGVCSECSEWVRRKVSLWPSSWGSCLSSRFCFKTSMEGMEVRLLCRQASLIELRLWSRTVFVKVSLVLVRSCVIVFLIMMLYFWLRELLLDTSYIHFYGLLSIWSMLNNIGVKLSNIIFTKYFT